ncbi:MAG: Gmad2 immunoglobulin-like domain-containing protein [Candidatus Paceibacterota bacterium]|jgi:uncharacterized protein YxeA
MKKIIWIIGLVIFAVVVSVMFVPKHNTIDGKIAAIDSTNRVITIKNQDQIIDLLVTNNTKLYDKSDRPALFSDFNVGFEVTASLNKNGNAEVIEKIKMTSSPNIIIIAPENNSVVKNGFQVKGVARVFENVLQVQAIDKKTGQIIFDNHIMAEPLDIGLFGPFEATINFPAQNDISQVEISAFQYSAKDGSVIDKTIINLDVVK